MRTDILPPNSTPLEQKLSSACQPAILDLGDNDAIRGRKFDPPDNWLDALIWEYALGEITPYIADKRRLIDEGIRWTRLRGTPASLHLAFSWVGMTADIIESPPSIEPHQPHHAYQPHRHFAEYDLHLHGFPAPADICRLANLAVLSQPVRARLWRLVYGYDRGVFRLDDSLLDDALLDDDSGIRLDHAGLPCLPKGDTPKISLRRRHASHAEREESGVQAVYITRITRRITRHEIETLYLDDLPLPFEIYTSIITGAAPRAAAVYYGQVWADQPWPTSNWQATNALVTNCKEKD